MTDPKIRRSRQRKSRRPTEGRADEPERPPTIQEEEGVAPHQLEDPPQAEGDRDDVD